VRHRSSRRTSRRRSTSSSPTPRFAFAFFAADFYFFTDCDNDFTTSEVTRLDHDDSDMNGKQDLTKLTDDAPLLIVGAGVSTCAPVAPQ
jgi:hypothetical protein